MTEVAKEDFDLYLREKEEERYRANNVIQYLWGISSDIPFFVECFPQQAHFSKK